MRVRTRGMGVAGVGASGRPHGALLAVALVFLALALPAHALVGKLDISPRTSDRSLFLLTEFGFQEGGSLVLTFQPRNVRRS